MNTVCSRNFLKKMFFGVTIFLCFTHLVHAETIDFNDSPISFNPPIVVSGSAQVTSTQPTLIKTENGYSIQGLGYTITNTSTSGSVQVMWNSSRPFYSSILQDLIVVTGGDTTVSISNTNDTVRFFVDTFIDLGDGPSFRVNPVDPNAPNLSWNESAFVYNVSAGSHNLNMRSGIVWFPSSVNETLTISSTYGESIVPEPSSFLLIGIGFFAMSSFYRRKCESVSLG